MPFFAKSDEPFVFISIFGHSAEDAEYQTTMR